MYNDSSIARVWVCSSPHARHAYDYDPMGHCPACVKAGQGNWSCITVSVQANRRILWTPGKPEKPAYLPVLIGDARRRIYAGPYRAKPDGMFGIKLAEEIKAPADFEVPIHDFGVPKDPRRLRTGLAMALDLVARGRPLYVGCMGGRGRTGLFLALFAKATGIDGSPVEDKWGEPIHPAIAYVRRMFNPAAVETKEQEEYVAELDLKALRWAIWKARGTAALVDWTKEFGPRVVEGRIG